METVKITYDGRTVRMQFNGAQASAPIKLDGVSTQYQTADARHRTDWAVLLIASHVWPDAEWPSCPRNGSDEIEANEAWDALAYETELSEQEVITLAESDGVEDVNTVLDEQGIDVVIATLAPGHVAWDEAAINAGVAEQQNVPREHRELYYSNYARAARERAEELRNEHDEEAAP